jgi:hypothetical protein
VETKAEIRWRIPRSGQATDLPSGQQSCTGLHADDIDYRSGSLQLFDRDLREADESDQAIRLK